MQTTNVNGAAGAQPGAHQRRHGGQELGLQPWIRRTDQARQDLVLCQRPLTGPTSSRQACSSTRTPTTRRNGPTTRIWASLRRSRRPGSMRKLAMLGKRIRRTRSASPTRSRTSARVRRHHGDDGTRGRLRSPVPDATGDPARLDLPVDQQSPARGSAIHRVERWNAHACRRRTSRPTRRWSRSPIRRPTCRASASSPT